MPFKPPNFTPQVNKFAFRYPKKSIYSLFQVPGSHRLYRSTRVYKHWRTRSLLNLTAFFRNRFYEQDSWYKARIVKPEIFPTCYIIDPEEQRFSLVERLKAIQENEDQNRVPIDIGFPVEKSMSKDGTVKDRDFEELESLKKLAFKRQLQIDIKEIENDLASSEGVQMRKRVAEHYNIFKDLFHEDAFFNPIVNLHICYPGDDETSVNPVFYGNSLYPKETVEAPSMSYNAENGSYWTLLLTNPDGNIFEENKEILHWMICNIPENRISEGQVLCDYLQPLPLKNTSFHRMVFVLFKQNDKLDVLSELKLGQPCNDLKARTFSTPDFYLKYEDLLTPAGLAFFQSEWDESCTTCFHQRLNMEQPLYDFDWPEPYIEPQEEVPSEYKPFNVYLDKYRDYKDIDKEILLKRLKRVSPFQADPEKPKFPNLLFRNEKETLPSWLHLEKVKENEGYGKYRGVYENPID